MPTLASGQATNVSPTQVPSNAVVSLKASSPHVLPNGASLLLRVTSLTGSPLLIAAPSYHEGWSVYTSSGQECSSARIETPAMPSIDRRGTVNGASGFTAGVNAPALIPVNVYCQIRRDEELSMNIILYVGKDGRWVPQHFALSQQVVQ